MRYICVIILIAGLCHGASKATECTTSGRFPNDDAEDCRGYTMCLMGAAQTFVQYKLTCPIGSVYSHRENQCTNATNYQCAPSYACTEAGYFKSPFRENCTSYIACIVGINHIVTARQIECPSEQVFNPSEGVCVNSTKFQCNIVNHPNIDKNITSTTDTTSVNNNETVNASVDVTTSFSISKADTPAECAKLTIILVISYCNYILFK